MEEFNMVEFVNKALPGINPDIIKKVADRLSELGMLFEQDVKYIEESYLTDILKPILLKKFVDYCSNSIKPGNLGTPSNSGLSQVVLNASINMNNYDNSSAVSIKTSNWAEDFKIPWSSFPSEVLEVCEKKGGLKKHIYCEMIRNLTTHISKIDSFPGRKNLRIIAKKIAAQYPETFQDRCGDVVITDGCTTLMKKIENCFENKNRKREREIFDNDPDVHVKKTLKNSYACCDWLPKQLPDGETKTSQIEHKNWLIAEAKKVIRDEEKINRFMMLTYASQRYDIICKKHINEISKEWPILFENEYFRNHADTLLNKENCANQIIENINIKGKIIYDFMKSKVTSSNEVQKCLIIIEDMKKQLKNITSETVGAISLLMAYFGEEEKELFQLNMDPIYKEDLEKSPKQLTPFLATSGGNIYTADEFHIVIDGISAISTDSFLMGFALMFLSYYVFNIEYPEKASLTLEFVQRIFADINPERGNKTVKIKGKKQHTVAPRVMKVINQLRDFECHFKL